MPKKLHDCVKKVEKKKGTKNAYAICQASINKGNKSSKGKKKK